MGNKVGSKPAGKPHILNARGVCEHLDISKATLYRWLVDEALDFPKPYMTVKTRNYWRLADLLKWAKSQAVPDPASLDGMKVLAGPIVDYEDLVLALRNRRNQLKLPVLEVDALSGMQEGYTTKLENWGQSYARGAGPESLPRWLRGLRVGLVLVALPEAS